MQQTAYEFVGCLEEARKFAIIHQPARQQPADDGLPFDRGK